MFCIAAFIVLAIISIFSVKYRKLAKKAWNCTLHRVTFRPCDTSFKEETKSKILSHVANKTPRLVKAADVMIEVLSFILVILTVWSLLTAARSGLNLLVWGTCNTSNASSCSLGSETCSIDKVKKGFWELTQEGKPWQWFVDDFSDLLNTIENIPARLKTWNAEEYLPKNVSYYYKKDSSKPTALEVLDPGCIVCAKLFKNIKDAGFEERYNLAYIAYPIKNTETGSGYKFKNSYTVAKYLEAIKLSPLKNLKTPADWQIIERIFTWTDNDGTSYQNKINLLLNEDETIELLHSWLSDIGYTSEQIAKIDDSAKSQTIADAITANMEIVEKSINTLKIPTIIFNGHRNDGLVTVNSLK